MGPQRRNILMGLFLAAALTAGLTPFARTGTASRSAAADGFPGWPQQYEGRPLVEAPLTPREHEFARDFPGQIGRFTDGSRELIIRWVRSPTRRLHPASDCFRGAGYRVTPRPVERNGAGALTGCFEADGSAGRFHVCEHVVSPSGQTWPDVSAWYWSALLWPDGASWWSYVTAEPRQ